MFASTQNHITYTHHLLLFQIFIFGFEYKKELSMVHLNCYILYRGTPERTLRMPGVDCLSKVVIAFDVTRAP